MDLRIRRQLSKLARISKMKPNGRKARMIRRRLARLGWTQATPEPVVAESAPKPKRKASKKAKKQ